ncbi:MAG TPA: hypothetical protein PKX51_20375 [Cyclobacteriaceae bacterium]|nr:hypothetical protein [Cyclobacteriaceae bacterium]
MGGQDDPEFTPDNPNRYLSESDEMKLDFLTRLKETQKVITENRTKQIMFSQPLLCQNGNSVIFPRTINLIQGKTGVHKSRLAESMCACFINRNKDYINPLGFESNATDNPVVCYIDTERNITEQFPYAIQQILKNAGYPITHIEKGFEYTSLLEFNRNERLDALIVYIEDIRKKYGNKNIVVVLDVVSDCIINFNDSTESLKLIDFMNQTINHYNVTFICVIHENPGSSEKARGHAGTELSNKSSTVIQIGLADSPDKGSNELIKMTYLKCRGTRKHEPVYFRYSDENKRLELAREEEIKEAHNNRQQKAPVQAVCDMLGVALVHPLEKAMLMEELKKDFKCGERILEDRLTQIINDRMEIKDIDKKTAYLQKLKDGRNIVYKLIYNKGEM